MADQFASQQPKHGETIIHCGHLKCRNHHFFKMKSGPAQFRRPDQTIGEAQWVVICEDCFQQSGGDPTKVQIRGDGEWQGDEPAVLEPEVQ